MLKFYRWYAKNRPKILYHFWYTLLIINLLGILFVSYFTKGYQPVSLKLAAISIVSYLFIRVWKYYIINPDKYQQLLNKRAGKNKKPKDKEDS